MGDEFEGAEQIASAIRGLGNGFDTIASAILNGLTEIAYAISEQKGES